MAKLSLDYEGTLVRIQRLHNIADEVGNVSSNLRRINDDIPSYWKGAAADSYEYKADALQSRIKNSCNTLHSLADQIRRIAEIIHLQDLRDAEEASKL